MKIDNLQKLVRSISVFVGLLFANLCSHSLADDKKVFIKNCGVCHTLSADGPSGQGPPLNNIIGRKAGDIETFVYSDGLKAANWVWSAKILDQWLEDPKSVIPDSYMMYRQSDPKVRQQIIRFLVSN